MALSEVTQLDQIIIEPVTGVVSWRVTTYIIKDGTEIISKSYFRSSMTLLQALPPEWPAYLTPFRNLVDTPAARALEQAALDRAMNIVVDPNPPIPLPTNFP